MERPDDLTAADAAGASDLAAAFLARRRALVAWVLGGVGGALLVSLLVAPRYVATVTILPRPSSTALPLLRDLALLGLPEAPADASLEAHYGRIVESDRVLDPLLAASWPDPGAGGAPQDLFTLLGVGRAGGAGDPAAAAALRKRLRTRVIAFSRGERDGYMELKVTVPRRPWLAAAIADSLAARLGAFVQDYRTGKAQERARFVEARVRETEAALAAADDALTEFVQANRSFEVSAPLAQEHRRLSREVDALARVWSELRSQLELARIESHDRQRALDVLDAARVPVERAWPRHTLSAVAGLLLGLAGWAASVLGAVALRGARASLRRPGPD